MALHAMTMPGEVITLKDATIAALRACLRGPLLDAESDGYDAARTLWNAHIARRPALIACCCGVADVLEAVAFARTHHLLISVRGGGHNFPGTSLCEGGLVIDLSRMTSVRVDPIRRTARAEGGAKWGHVDWETQAFGLATTGGTDSDTGIGGLTLGGGLGWLGGKYGLACDNLCAADIITADGQMLTASATEHPDLFWALRGGGGNFGIVTSFEYQLHAVGPLLAGIVAYPFAQAQAVLRFYREFVRTTPDELNTACALRTLPDGTRVVGIAVCYHGSLETGAQVLRPLESWGRPLLNTIQTRSYVQVQHLLDGVTPAGNRYYGKSHFLADLGEEAIALMIEHFAHVPSPLSVLVFQQLGAAANRMAPEATAFSHRAAWGNLNLIGQWTAPDDATGHIEWVRKLWDALVPYATGGVYVTNVGCEAEEGTAAMRAAYGTNYDRLVAVKTTYDPTNLFRHNQNIPPRQS
jgi:FAD/FMN-containing dehydrogenase